jgi:hypothetical protein
MGTFDHLIIAMGIHLAHIHGNDKVVVVSADDRLADILAKCKSTIKPATRRKLKMDIAEGLTGRSFAPELFPCHLNLKRCKNKEIAAVFGEWPLPVSKVPKTYRWLK